MPEFFDGRFHAGAGSPDVVEKDIGIIWIYWKARVDLIGMFGLGEASVVIGADLSGIIGAEKDEFNWVVAEMREVFGNEESMVEAASANVISGRRKGDDDSAGDFLGQFGI